MSFNVICNSSDAYGGDGEYNFTYQFDWNSIPEGEYELTWSFQVKLRTHTTQTDHFENSVSAISLPDLGIKNTFRCSSTASSATTSGVIGFCQQYLPEGSEDDAGAYYWTKAVSYALWHDNPPVKLMRPSASIFRVLILKEDLEVKDDFSKDYVLILHFKKC